jgi:hypothetical protein
MGYNLKVLSSEMDLAGLYKWEIIDDDQKKFFPQLAIDTDFFHCVFASPCIM